MATVQERLGQLEGQVSGHAQMFKMLETRFDGLDQRVDYLVRSASSAA